MKATDAPARAETGAEIRRRFMAAILRPREVIYSLNPRDEIKLNKPWNEVQTSLHPNPWMERIFSIRFAMAATL
jgi:hypothetical protein